MEPGLGSLLLGNRSAEKEIQNYFLNFLKKLLRVREQSLFMAGGGGSCGGIQLNCSVIFS